MSDLTSDGPPEAGASILQNLEPENAYLGRQPILNREGALIAFELLFRSGTDNLANHIDDGQATAHVVARAIGEMGVDAALGPHLGFVNIGGDMLVDESLRVIPPARFVLEIPVWVARNPENLVHCQLLREVGYRLALDDVAGHFDDLISLLPYFDFVKIDFVRCPKDQIASLVELLKQHGKALIALKVESIAEYELAKEHGFDLFQGYYFARPEVLSSRRASASHGALLRLLQLLLADPDNAELEAELKLNPTVVMHLMRLVNSGAFGLGRNVSSIREAIMAAGIDRITRWTQLLLYADRNGLPFDSDPLVQLASVRAHFMELAASRLHNHDRRLLDSAFLTGVFSLIDVVFGGAIEDILSGLALSVPITEAILHRRGQLGQLLALAEAAERGDQITIDSLCEGLQPMNSASVAEDSLSAMEIVNCSNQQTETVDELTDLDEPDGATGAAGPAPQD
jgi:EAL and modified HD-GYP domain-containing signal transduction protein